MIEVRIFHPQYTIKVSNIIPCIANHVYWILHLFNHVQLERKLIFTNYNSSHSLLQTKNSP